MEPSFSLEVGSVVQLVRDNDTVDGPYLVNYLSPTQLILADPEGKQQLPISNGEISAPPGVKTLRIIYTPKTAGYVALIGAKVGDTLDLSLADKSVVKAKVLSITNDMLELQVGEKKLYLDFAYRGIDPLWGIDAIRVAKSATREAAPSLPSPKAAPGPSLSTPSPPLSTPSPPLSTQSTGPSTPYTTPPTPLADEDDESEATGEVAPPEEDLDAFEQALEEGAFVGDLAAATVRPQVRMTNVQQDIIHADKIKFVGALGEVQQRVAVSEDVQRYTLDHQVQDLLDSLLSEHPSNPDPRVLRRIQNTINSYRVLYQDHTRIGGNGVALGAEPIQSTPFPLAAALADPEFSTFWLLPTTVAAKKFYDTEGADEVGGIDYQREQIIEAQNVAEANAERNEPPFPKGRVAGTIMAAQPYLEPYAPELDRDEDEDDGEGVPVPLPKPATQVVVTTGTNEAYALKKGQLEVVSMLTWRATPTGQYGTQVSAPLGETVVKHFLVGPEKQVERTGYLSLGLEGAELARYLHGNIYDRAVSTNSSRLYAARMKKLTESGKEATDGALPDPGAVPFRSMMESYDVYLNKLAPKAEELVNMLYRRQPGPVNIPAAQRALEPFGAKINKLPFHANMVLRLRMQEAIGQIKAAEAQRLAANQRYANIRPQAFRRYNVRELYPPNAVKQYRLRNDTLVLDALAMMLRIDQGAALFYDVSLSQKDASLPRALADRAETLMADDNLVPKTPEEPAHERERAVERGCSLGQVAKHYATETAMKNDLQKALTGGLKFDAELDPTRKDVLEAVPRPPGMEDNKYIDILREYLTKENGLRPNVAQTEAESLVSGGRTVQVGDYVTVGPLRTVYRLGPGEWIGDEPTAPTGDGKKVCADKLDCLATKTDCSTPEDTNSEAVVRILRQEANKMFSQPNERETYGERALRELPRLIEFALERNTRGGGDLEAVGKSDEEAIQSPHMPLLQAILAQSDLGTKQSDLRRFEMEFTVPGPTEWVRVCKDTGVPIFPTFLSELAEAYYRGDYVDALEKVCATRGTLSEMGDLWVDRYSGMTIKVIDYAVDLDTATDTLPEPPVVLLAGMITDDGPESTSQEADITRQTVKGVGSALGIELSDEQMEFIQSQVVMGLAARLPNRTDYEARRERMRVKANKTLPSYEYISENMTVMLALCGFIVAVQTAERPTKAKRFIPGCPRTLVGFPLNPDIKEDTAVRTVACVVNRIKTDNPPWTTLEKTGEQALTMQLLKFLSVMSETPSVAGMLETRRSAPVETDEQEGEGVVVGVWTGYLPPADLPQRGDQRVESDRFRPSYGEHLATAWAAMKPGFMLQSEERKVVKANEPQLKTINGVPYTNNACCAGKSVRPKDAAQLVRLADALGRRTLEWQRCVHSPAFVLIKDTKPVYPPIPQEDDEETEGAVIRRYCGGDPSQSASALAECPGPEQSRRVGSLRVRVDEVLAAVFRGSTVPDPLPAVVPRPDPRGFKDRALALAQLCVDVVNSAAGDRALLDQAMQLRDSAETAVRTEIEKTKMATALRQNTLRSIQAITRIDNIDDLISATQWVSRTWPAMITNEVSSTPPPPPTHWGLSYRHQQDVMNLWTRQIQAFAPFYGNEPLRPLLLGSLGTPHLAKLLSDTHESVRVHIGPNPGDPLNNIMVVLAQTGLLISFDIGRFSPEGVALPKQLGTLLLVLAQMTSTRISSTREALESLRRRLLVAKEKEKDQITNFLKNMTDEQREIENLMKNNKLGKWAKGQSKELYSYTKESYDAEMAVIESLEANDVQLQDALGRVRVGAEINELIDDPDVAEAMDMSGLAEDDDFGDLDGDEAF